MLTKIGAMHWLLPDQRNQGRESSCCPCPAGMGEAGPLSDRQGHDRMRLGISGVDAVGTAKGEAVKVETPPKSMASKAGRNWVFSSNPPCRVCVFLVSMERDGETGTRFCS